MLTHLGSGMSRNLKKFVNPSFVRTVDLLLMGRLLQRHRDEIRGFAVSVLDGDEKDARQALLDFFAGPEENYPKGLIADLHRIAELGTQNGMPILLARAKASGVELIPPAETDGDALHLNPKHLALRAFLDFPRVFNAASDILALEARQALGEFAGAEEGIAADLTEATKAAFQTAMAKLLKADLMGSYCRVGWYGDEDEINVVVTHGTIVTTTEVISDGREEVISYRGAQHSVLSYQAATGRLKVGGVPKAQRLDVAAVFAGTMLDHSEFFAGADSGKLYTLDPIEKKGFGFTLDTRFDPGIKRAAIVEVQAEKIARTNDAPDSQASWTVVVRDRWNALARMGQVTRSVTFEEDSYRLGYIIIDVGIDSGAKRPARVTVKLKPPSVLMFKRHRFEGRILELLRRNGFCLERKSPASAVAAQ